MVLKTLNNPDSEKIMHLIDARGHDSQFLKSLGERVTSLRASRGMTRKFVSETAGVSERHLANLEYGKGNVSILVLVQIAEALQCDLAQLIGDPTTASAEWLLIRQLLIGRDENTLRKVRIATSEMMGIKGGHSPGFSPVIALVGLRGAGKSTLGHMLADDLGFQFIELSREIERLVGCTTSEIQSLYGMNAYRKYERRALEETLQIYPEAIIATPGGIVSDPGTYNLLLGHCTTVWLQARPEDHMYRVAAQGDLRPMAQNPEAMEDLKKILLGRSTFYSQASMSLDTSAQNIEETFIKLRAMVRKALNLEI